MTQWIVWSEEHGGWWKPGGFGYTYSLKDAGRYSEERARQIEDNANRFLTTRDFNEVAMPDPLERKRDDRG